MKNLFWAAMLILFGCAGSYACGSMQIPPPGSCTLQFLTQMQTQLHTEANELRNLAKEVRKDQQLHIDEVQAMTMNTDPLNASATASVKSGFTALQLARQIETLRPKLSQKEWRRVTKLWSKALKAQAVAIESYHTQDICSLAQSGGSMATDAGYIFLGPAFGLAAMGETNGASLGLAVVGPMVGVVGLAADVVTLVPQQAAIGFQQLLKNASIRRCQLAYAHFAAAVYSDEQRLERDN